MPVGKGGLYICFVDIVALCFPSFDTLVYDLFASGFVMVIVLLVAILGLCLRAW